MAVAKLHLSPFVLTAAMFDNANSIGDQEGFLLGSSQKSIRPEISDHSMFNTEEDLIMSIYSCVPCGSVMSFYDGLGNVFENKLEEFLCDRKKDVVGWYRYRRNLVIFPSSRDMLVHKNLQKYFSGNIFIGDPYFVFGVLGSATYPTPATHTYDYAFYNQIHDSFKSLQINLLNLGDTKSDYRGESLSGSFIHSATFNSIIEVPWDLNSCWQTEDAIQQMQRMLREKSDSLVEELTASESVNNSIEKEIKKLEEELKSLTVKEPVKTKTKKSDSKISVNNSNEKISLPLSLKLKNILKKRSLMELMDVSQEPHPAYGKYFFENQEPQPGCSYKSEGIVGINYNRLPPKKKIKVIYKESRRKFDNDCENEFNSKPPEEIEPGAGKNADVCNTDGFLSSHETGFLCEEEVPISLSKGKEPKVQVVYVNNDDDQHFCPEPICEEIVETTKNENDMETLKKSPSNTSNKSQGNVSPKIINEEEGIHEESKEKKTPDTSGPTIIFLRPSGKERK